VISLSPAALALAIWRRCAGQFREYGLFTTGWSDSFGDALTTACDWLAPWPLLPLWLRAFCVALVMVSSFALTDSELRLERSSMPAPVERSARLATLLRVRLLSPIIVSATWLMAAVIIRRWQALPVSSRAALAAYLGLWFAGNIATSAATVSELRREGLGYGSQAWQEGAFAHWLRGPGRHYELYTNNPSTVWIIDRHPARMLPTPEEIDPLPAFVRKLRSTPSAIIGFSDPFDPTLDPAALARQVGFVQVARFERASVWAAAAIPPASVLAVSVGE
jgi:hypothetical protein